MPDHARFLNVIDVEATCWETTAPEGHVSEIIEVGLCVVDLATRERVERDRILVRPEVSRVSDFCEQLTGLTQDEVDGGVDFREACAILAERHRGASRRWASWGNYDRNQFQRQCDGRGIPYPFAPRHINAKAVFADMHGRKTQVGMARALRQAGLPLEGRHHNGADDAWNIAALVLHMMDRGVWPGGPSSLGRPALTPTAFVPTYSAKGHGGIQALSARQMNLDEPHASGQLITAHELHAL